MNRLGSGLRSHILNALPPAAHHREHLLNFPFTLAPRPRPVPPVDVTHPFRAPGLPEHPVSIPPRGGQMLAPSAEDLHQALMQALNDGLIEPRHYTAIVSRIGQPVGPPSHGPVAY